MQHVQWRQWPAFDAMLIVLHCCVHHNYSSCSSVVHEDDRKLSATIFCIQVGMLDSWTQSYREFIVILCPASHRLAMLLHQLLYWMHRPR